MSSPLLLHRDVHFCEADRTIIFLDTATGKYFHLPEKQTSSFAQILEVAQLGELPDHARQLAESLVARHLLTLEADEGKPLKRGLFHAPHSSSLEGLQLDGRISVSAALTMILSIVPCWRSVRTRDLKRTLELANKWRRRCKASSDNSQSHLESLVRDFHSASPLLFSTHDACLFRSLVLLKFLSTRGVSADWVFGVRFGPFRAHCWIEYQGVVLNDFLENISDYHPIMSV